MSAFYTDTCKKAPVGVCVCVCVCVCGGGGGGGDTVGDTWFYCN